MWNGYLISQWIGVVEWLGSIMVLGVFVFCISVYLSNWILKEEARKDKLYEVSKDKNKKKQVFFDVA